VIIQVGSVDKDDLEAARRSLEELTSGWGHPVSDASPMAAASQLDGPSKVIDPIELTTMLLAIPPAALATVDLADRITKRRRAKDLVDKAKQLTTQNVIINVITGNHTVNLANLDPDHLLNLAGGDEQADS
jgi:hypothetical protein